MKQFYLSILFGISSFLSIAQTVVATREIPTDLDAATYAPNEIGFQNGISGYQTSGSAIVTEYSDGKISITLGDDFSRSGGGPDIRVFLTKEINTELTTATLNNGTTNLFFGNVSTDNHLSGSKTYTVQAPSGVDINTFDYIILHCFLVNGRWGHGLLKPTVNVTGINDQKEKLSLEFFPNPANDNITVNLPSETDSSTIKIFSLLGEELKSEQIIGQAESTINVEDLDQGTYILSVETSSQIHSSKLVVN